MLFHGPAFYAETTVRHS